MRTTVVIPDQIVAQIRALAGSRPLSAFVREAVQERLENLRRLALAAEMEVGYRAEAEASSLPPEWTDVETEGW